MSFVACFMTSLNPTNQGSGLHFPLRLLWLGSVGECLEKKTSSKIHVFSLTMAPSIGVNLRVTGHCDQVIY